MATCSQPAAWLGVLLWIIALSTAQPHAAALASEPSPKPVQLLRVPLPQGFRESAFGADRQRAVTTSVYKAAASVGIDLLDEPDPIVECAMERGRLFYLFYNNADAGDDACKFMVQRMHKRVINYESDDDPSPEVIDSYSVEGFKCVAGKLKRPDQHFGAFSIGNFAKRVIEKELEVGVPVASYANNQGQWPYEQRILFKQIVKDAPARDDYDAVDFKRSIRWTIRVEFDREGNYEVHSPEVGIKILRECTLPASS